MQVSDLLSERPIWEGLLFVPGNMGLTGLARAQGNDRQGDKLGLAAIFRAYASEYQSATQFLATGFRLSVASSGLGQGIAGMQQSMQPI
jgi:hypothetical protein